MVSSSTSRYSTIRLLCINTILTNLPFGSFTADASFAFAAARSSSVRTFSLCPASSTTIATTATTTTALDMVTQENSRGGGFRTEENDTTYHDQKESLTASEKYIQEALAMAHKFGFTDFEAWLTTGGDDRSLILPDTGANKYHIQPRPILPSQIFRGSCTGNPPTRTGYDAAKKLFDEKICPHLLNNHVGDDDDDLESILRDIFQDQSKRLAKYLDLPPGSEIILCPSGSDAEYIPIAIAKSLTRTKAIVNGVTQLNEIGAGTAPASTGKYFSKYAPFLGDHGLEYLAGYEGIKGVIVDAREKDGTVVDASKIMADFVHEQMANENYPIVHGVFGGKTGVRDTIMPESLGQGNDSLGIVDACQGRFTQQELKEWLQQDSLVLFTTSKFYQAPPFCGAVILPPSIATKLSNASCPPPKEMLVDKGLLAFITDKELPPCMESWKTFMNVKGRNNVGLALRWEAGLASMEKIASISDDDRTAMTIEWATSVKTMVDTNPFLDTFCVERSIISIRLAAGENQWLGMKEARDVFRWMSLDVSSTVPDASPEEREALASSAFIGQPVSVSEDFAIVRIALGVDSLLEYSKDKASTLKEDQMVVNKLGAIAKYYDLLVKSGV
jgi:hypothetical protein